MLIKLYKHMFLIVICWIISKCMCLLKCFAYNQLRTRTFLWQPTSSDEPKNSVKGGEKSSLFELRRLEIGGVSFDDFSLLHVSFLRIYETAVSSNQNDKINCPCVFLVRFVNSLSIVIIYLTNSNS